MSFLERLKRLVGSGDAPAPPSTAEGDIFDALPPITCMEAVERLQEYLDGELEAVSHEEVTRHFDMCQKCYPHLQLEKRFLEALERSRGEEPCPEHVRAQVLELLAAEAGDPPG